MPEPPVKLHRSAVPFSRATYWRTFLPSFWDILKYSHRFRSELTALTATSLTLSRISPYVEVTVMPMFWRSFWSSLQQQNHSSFAVCVGV